MNKYTFGAVVLILIGIILFGVSAALGEAGAGFILIFPFFIGYGIYSFIGVLCIFLGFILLFFGLASRFMPLDEEFEFKDRTYTRPRGKGEMRYTGEEKVEGGGVILIGPFPIIFGSNTRLVFWLVILAIILIVVMGVFLSLFFSFSPTFFFSF